MSGGSLEELCFRPEENWRTTWDRSKRKNVKRRIPISIFFFSFFIFAHDEAQRTLWTKIGEKVAPGSIENFKINKNETEWCID